MDRSGQPIRSTFLGFNNFAPGGTIIVKGTVKREGKDAKTVRVKATGFYLPS